MSSCLGACAFVYAWVVVCEWLFESLSSGLFVRLFVREWLCKSLFVRLFMCR